MSLYFQDSHRTLYNHDCRLMPELPDESVQTVITSPPYWGLRKYAGEQELKGWDCAYGLEYTLELYIQHTVEILREIRRVLRKDGVVFWNIGDSYAGSGRGGNDYGGKGRAGSSMYGKPSKSKRIPRGKGRWGGGNSPASGVLKPKDLCLIPFRVAIAAQEDGWWVRSDIIWSKNNPMPESVTDRPTNSHEYILMLTKSAKYYWDAEAVREAVAESTIGRGPVEFGGAKGRAAEFDKSDPNFRNGSEQWGRTYDYTQSSAHGRNLRSIWTFPTQPYPEAHFATFPEVLPERCIKAATPEAGCCSKCGAPWGRVLEKHETLEHKPYEGKSFAEDDQHPYKRISGNVRAWRESGGEHDNPFPTPITLGWKPSCKCDAQVVPSIVLDPFTGSGTTLKVAAGLGRRAVGYEISGEYCRLAVERNNQHVLV